MRPRGARNRPPKRIDSDETPKKRRRGAARNRLSRRPEKTTRRQSAEIHDRVAGSHHLPPRAEQLVVHLLRRVRPLEDADRRCVTQVEVRPHPNVRVVLLTQIARLRPSRLTEQTQQPHAFVVWPPEVVKLLTELRLVQDLQVFSRHDAPRRLLGHGPTGGIARPGRTKLRSRLLRDRSPAQPNCESPSGTAASAPRPGSATTARLQPTCASWCAVVRPGTMSPPAGASRAAGAPSAIVTLRRVALFDVLGVCKSTSTKPIRAPGTLGAAGSLVSLAPLATLASLASPGRHGLAVGDHRLEMQRDRLLGVAESFVEVVARGGAARQVRHGHVVADPRLAAVRLFALAKALGNDYDRFEALVGRGVENQ